jgi:hypothetical protein
MKVKFGSIVTDGRGKLGGHVFQGNNGVITMRRHSVPTNSFCSFNSISSCSRVSVSGSWRSLSSSIRNRFKLSAVFCSKPDGSYPSAFGLYMSQQLLLRSLGVPSGFYPIINNVNSVVPFSFFLFNPRLGIITISSQTYLESPHLYCIRVSRPCKYLSSPGLSRLKSIRRLRPSDVSNISLITYYTQYIGSSFPQGYYIAFEMVHYFQGNPFKPGVYRLVMQIP